MKSTQEQVGKYNKERLITVPCKFLSFQTGGFDLAYFAPDCFHFSDLGTNAAAKSLWNNMVSTSLATFLRVFKIMFSKTDLFMTEMGGQYLKLFTYLYRCPATM